METASSPPALPSPFTFARLLRDGFAAVPDPRIEPTKLHLLSDLLMIALCTTLCGGDGYEHMPEWAKMHGVDWLRQHLGLSLPDGIAHHDTFRRVLSRVAPQAVEECLHTLARTCQSKIINLDGKELRHSFDSQTGTGALRLLNAWANDLHLVLAQEPVPAGGNEITAMPNLLEKLEVRGATVTADAMHCQTETAALLRRKGADYVLCLKENQPTVLASVSALFAQASSKGVGRMVQGREQRLPVESWQETDGSDHGRTEVRRCHVLDVEQWLPTADPLRRAWKDLRSLVLVERERLWMERGEPKEVHSHTFYLSSREPCAKTHGELVRGRWGVENKLHYVLDVSFGEDDSRVRRDYGPRNLALLRRLSLCIARHAPAPGRSVRLRRKMAGWSSTFLLQCLASWPVPQPVSPNLLPRKEGSLTTSDVIDN